MRKIILLALTLSAGCAPAMPRSAYTTIPEHRSPQAAPDTAGAAMVAEGWWRALTLGDTAFLSRHTSNRLTLTLSNGQRFDRSAMLKDASTHVPKPSTFVRPAVDVAVLPAGSSVIVTIGMAEGSQGGSNTYRYLAVLEREGSVWQVLAAQSTREITLTARVPAQAAGPLSDYVGNYRGQRGGIVQVVARDSVLAMLNPDGTEVRLEPIGPALFEVPKLYDGIAVLRFAFTRDPTGRVSSLSRLIYGSVISWARIP